MNRPCSGGRPACRRGRASRRPDRTVSFSRQFFLPTLAADARSVRRARRRGSTAGETPAATVHGLKARRFSGNSLPRSERGRGKGEGGAPWFRGSIRESFGKFLPRDAGGGRGAF